MKKIMKKIIFAILISLSIFTPTNADGNVPLITSTKAQIIQGGFSTNGFTAKERAVFEQAVDFVGIIRGKVINGIESISIGSRGSRISPKVITKTNITGGLVAKSIKVEELSSNNKFLCVDTNNGGKVVFCAPDICYGGVVDQKTPGSYTFNLAGCPPMDVIVKVWGAGGGGGGGEGAYWGLVSNGQTMGGGGGGSGAYLYKKFTATSPSYSYVVGNSGIGGTGCPKNGCTEPSNGKNGTNSSFSDSLGINLVASGGGGGKYGNIVVLDVRGIGGTASGGDINMNGSNGSNGSNESWCTGGSGGNGADSYQIGKGGAGAPCLTSNHDAGNAGSYATGYAAGGGGGGGAKANVLNSHTGGGGRSGTQGRVQIFW